MFLLDTNAISELRRPARANPGLIAWAESTPSVDLFISAITVFEIELGAALVGRRDAAQGAVLHNWIDGRVMPAFRGRILPVDADVVQRCAALHVPDPRPQGDSLIAANRAGSSPDRGDAQRP